MFNFFKKRLRIYYKLFLKEVLSIMDLFYLLKINKFKIGLWFMVFFIIMKKCLKYNLLFLIEFKFCYILKIIFSKYY